ncbi:MAG: DUF4271 domain-containing protein [Saprospiraceae bacterium]
MKKIAFLLSVSLWLLLPVVCLHAQQGNPFDLSPRLSPEALTTPTTADTLPPSTPQQSGNPFELQPRITSPAAPASEKPDSGNPFEKKTQTSPSQPTPPATNATISPSSNPTPATEGQLLVVVAGLLGLSTIILIFFRSLFGRIYKALFNDNLLTQLYREREAGMIGQFFIPYLLFFFIGGFFLYLLLAHFNWLPPWGFWQTYSSLTAAFAGVFITKHLLLALLGYIFPIEKETKRYSFTIMVFSIVGGLVLLVASLLLAYTPTDTHTSIVYGVAIIVLLLYAIRSIRGLFIGNRFIFNHQFHFLSYLCAVEIGPALVFIKLITGV